MFGLKELLLVFLTAGQALARSSDYCYKYNDDPYLKFGTKTAYNFVHGGKSRHQPVLGCKATQIWMLMTPGTRYPDKDTISKLMTLPKLRDQILYNHENRGLGHLCNEDLENLQLWRLEANLNFETSEELVKQGVEDLRLLASRMKTNFDELFPHVANGVSSGDYKFRSTDGEQTITSLKAFTSGLFTGGEVPAIETPINDTQFAPQLSCPKWQEEVRNNPDTLIEVKKFTEGPEYQNLTVKVSQRLGFLYNISHVSIEAMYDMCRYDKAWNVGSISAWCAVFSTDELKVLEYKDDLIEYYKHGYGSKMNLRLGCQPIQDMFQYFTKLEGGSYSNEPKGIFRVVNPGSLNLFMAAMGFANDTTPLLANNYRSSSKREWKMSEIGSFAANVAAVFYKCNDPRSPNKVMFYVGEKPSTVTYGRCSVGLCEWDYLKLKFEKTLSDCNLNFCYPSGAVSTLITAKGIVWLILPALAFFSR